MKNKPNQLLSNPPSESEESLNQDFQNNTADKLPEISDEELALILISML